MEGSDFSGSYIIGYGSSPSRCGPPTHASGQAGDLPVPEQRASVHARVLDHAEQQALAKTRPAVLPSTLPTVSALGSFYLRGSIPGLHSPRPTLRLQPHDLKRTAWGQCGSLFLHCSGLSPPTLRRSSGAPIGSLTRTMGAQGAVYHQRHREPHHETVQDHQEPRPLSQWRGRQQVAVSGAKEHHERVSEIPEGMEGSAGAVRHPVPRAPGHDPLKSEC